jgi:hypothetical protein
LVRPAALALGVAGVMLAIDQSPRFGADHERVTVGWSLLAGGVMALGFAFRSGIYRRIALGALSLCLLRVFLVDTQRLGDLTKPATFLLLAVCLLTAAWLYSRHAARIKQWL